MIITVITLLFLSVFLLDFIPVTKEKKVKTILVYGVIFASTFIILILHELRIEIPSPTGPIRYLINDVLNLK